MPIPFTAGMPRDLDLADGYIIRFSALNPTTGAEVAGVKVTGATLTVAALTVNVDQLEAGPWQLVPGQA